MLDGHNRVVAVEHETDARPLVGGGTGVASPALYGPGIVGGGGREGAIEPAEGDEVLVRIFANGNVETESSVTRQLRRLVGAEQALFAERLDDIQDGWRRWVGRQIDDGLGGLDVESASKHCAVGHGG